MNARLPTLRSFAILTALAGGCALAAPPAEAKTVHGDKGKYEPHGKKGKKGKGKNDKDGVGPFKKKDYPTAVRMRPLVLPDQMGQVGLDLDFSSVASVTSVDVVVDFDYGLGDKVDFGASTGLLLAPDVDWNHNLTLRGHYLAYDTKKFDFAPGIVIPITAIKDAPFSAVLDLPCRYVLSDGFFLRFGQGAIPIGLSPDFTLSVVGKGGVGYQATPKFLLFADLSVISLLLIPDADITGLWEQLDADLGGQYSPTKDWDIGAQLDLLNTWSVEKSFFWSLGVFGRYRF